MSSWNSYGKVYNVGHRAVRELTNYECYVEEKIDGSQFSFGVFDGEVRVRSKGREFPIDQPDKLFSGPCAWVAANAHLLTDGWTYRGEAVNSPKHNILEYSRVPNGNIVLFDIAQGEEDYLNRWLLEEEGARLGLEVVPNLSGGTILFSGSAERNIAGLESLLATESMLGGAKVEGVVIKPVQPVFGIDKKRLAAKHVSAEFREVAKQAQPKAAGPSLVDQLHARFGTEARWQKAIQHLRESGRLDESPKDIGPLIREIHEDTLGEASDEIAAFLLSHFRKEVASALTLGFPEWYKARLLEAQFAE